MQFVVFEKVYECLFIPNCTRKFIWLPVDNIHEKISPCWLMKKFQDGWAEGTHVYHAIREKLRHELRHPGHALDLKTKDLIGHLWVFGNFPVNQFNFKFLHSISTFWTNFVFLHALKKFQFLHCLGLIDMLSDNQHGEIFSCILLIKKSCPSFSTNEKQTYLCMRKHFTLHVLHALSDARPTHFARVSLLFLVLNLPST